VESHAPRRPAAALALVRDGFMEPSGAIRALRRRKRGSGRRMVDECHSGALRGIGSRAVGASSASGTVTPRTATLIAPVRARAGRARRTPRLERPQRLKDARAERRGSSPTDAFDATRHAGHRNCRRMSRGQANA
jgi:hypothetical protein